MKEIKLYNRDHADLRLVSEDEIIWEFRVDDEHDYIFEYMRVGYSKDPKTIEMIDPSGGPYISIGQRLSKDYVVESIFHEDGYFKIKTMKKQV